MSLYILLFYKASSSSYITLQLVYPPIYIQYIKYVNLVESCIFALCICSYFVMILLFLSGKNQLQIPTMTFD